MADERDEYDVGSLRVTRTEARDVLDRQIADINDLDDKAADTLRLNVLLFGVVLTVASLLAGSDATPNVEAVVNAPVVAGTIASSVSMVTAIWTYTNTSYRTGAGAADIRRFLSTNPSEDEWLAALLFNYATWLESNAKQNLRDRSSLFASHVSLFLSLGYYAGGVAYGVYLHPLDWWASVLVVCGYGGILGAVLFAPRHPKGRAFARWVRELLDVWP